MVDGTEGECGWCGRKHSVDKKRNNKGLKNVKQKYKLPGRIFNLHLVYNVILNIKAVTTIDAVKYF